MKILEVPCSMLIHNIREELVYKAWQSFIGEGTTGYIDGVTPASSKHLIREEPRNLKQDKHKPQLALNLFTGCHLELTPDNKHHLAHHLAQQHLALDRPTH